METTSKGLPHLAFPCTCPPVYSVSLLSASLRYCFINIHLSLLYSSMFSPLLWPHTLLSLHKSGEIHDPKTIQRETDLLISLEDYLHWPTYQRNQSQLVPISVCQPITWNVRPRLLRHTSNCISCRRAFFTSTNWATVTTKQRLGHTKTRSHKATVATIIDRLRVRIQTCQMPFTRNVFNNPRGCYTSHFTPSQVIRRDESNKEPPRKCLA